MLHIIIPTYNAQSPLTGLLTDLMRRPEWTRVIVADGGSDDDTLGVAARAGTQLAIGARGRGPQLALGAQLATLSGSDQDWFLFLHADSRLPENWANIVRGAMRFQTPRYFRFRADARGVRARWIEWMVNLRSAGWGIPYGDQGLLVSRADYERVGGYKPMALFEDVDLVERLGHVAPLRASLRTDVSAHLQEGIWTRGRRNLRLLTRYRRGASIEDLLADYRQ